MPSDTPKLPPISRELIEALERLYPERSPEKGETLPDLMFRGGQQQVVRSLREHHRRQQKNILETR